MPLPIYLGCVGWSLPAAQQLNFPVDGSHLQRYAAQFSAVEINSSFYRPHRRQTYQRWAASVHADFKFSVKMPKAITHGHKLKDAQPLLAEFFDQASGLAEKLACILIQLPPSLDYENQLAENFLTELRKIYQGTAVLEARHASWFETDASQQLARANIAQVIADPARFSAQGSLAASSPTAYFRLHGSPRIYYSAYTEPYLDQLALRLARARQAGQQVWCIFDNTAAGAAIGNALSLQRRLEQLT